MDNFNDENFISIDQSINRIIDEDEQQLFSDTVLQIHKDIENLLSDNMDGNDNNDDVNQKQKLNDNLNDDDDDNKNDIYSHNTLRWLDQLIQNKSSTSRLSIWSKDPNVIEHMKKFENNNNNNNNHNDNNNSDDINESVQQQQHQQQFSQPILNQNQMNDNIPNQMNNNDDDDDHKPQQQQQQQQESNEHLNQFNFIMNCMKLSRLENDKRIDSINTNHGSGIDQNQIEYSFNEYYQYCLIELQRLEKDIDYSIMKKSNLMKSICIEQQQQQQSVYEHCNNHDQNQNKSSSQSKWPISSSSSLVDGQINSNQLHLFIWNLFNLYEKLSSFFHRFSNNTCPSTSSIINNNQLDTNNSSSLIMQVITVWYQIVEEIKDNLVEQQNLTTTTTTTANYFDPMIMIMNNNNNNLSITTATTTLEQKINELKQQQILFLKLLWQFTRHIRLIHWIQDF